MKSEIALSALLAVMLAGSAAADSPWPEKRFNPKPQPDDVILPMPCGGAMAFRKIEVPGGGLLDDYQMTLGDPDPNYAYSEYSRPSAIDAPFSDGPSSRYYLMSKYETTQLQYQAVTAKACPKPELTGRLPITGITRLEAEEFANRYSLWLIAHAAEKMPKAGSAMSFIRLPTEVEWEYAARGGLAVAAPQFEEPTFPMPEGMEQYVWYAGTESANGKLQLTGQLKPNPLGLYDMLGNADEFVADLYQLDRVKRLHGRAGGDVIKGGSYLSSKEDIRSAYRIEFAPYTGQGARRSNSTGFRVIVTAPVLASDTAVGDARNAWIKLGQNAQPESSVSLSDPVAEIQALTRMAEGDAPLKTRLEVLGRTMKDKLTQIEDQRALAVRALIDQGAWLGAFLHRENDYIENALQVNLDKLIKDAPDDPQIATRKAGVKAYRDTLDTNVTRYGSLIIQLSTYDQNLLQLEKEALDTELTQRHASYLNKFSYQLLADIARYRSDKTIRSSDWLKEVAQLSVEQ